MTRSHYPVTHLVSSGPQSDVTLLFVDQVSEVGGDGGAPTLALDDYTDPQAIALVREGSQEAFDVLYRRHLNAALYVARTQADNFSDADDVVAEAFASIYQSLTEGKGPKEYFRSYLLTVVRRTAHDRNRKSRRVPVAGDNGVLDSVVIDEDRIINEFESAVMAKAFRSLPERWQAVLWHVDIEGLKPAAAAPFIGLSPNGVSSLALRAREGLRQAYLQFHIGGSPDDGCAEFSSQLGKYARNALKRTTREKVDAHLAGCAKCTALLVELNDIQSGMRTLLFPLLTGVAFTPGVVAAYLSGTAPLPGGTSVAAASSDARRSGSPGKITAAVVAGALALAGLAAALVPTGSETTAAPDSATEAPPAVVDPSATPSGRAEPPAAIPTSDPPAAVPTEPAASPAPRPAVVVVPIAPAAPRAASVVDSPVVLSTSRPAPSNAASAAAARTVDATFTAVRGSNPTERELNLVFSLMDNGAAESAEAIFSLPDQATFVAGKTTSPAGWTCSSAAENSRQIRCATPALDPHGLDFKLVVAMPVAVDRGTLHYQFGGQGIVTKTFSNAFH
jgi:RNA polymerase sigma factor (sigma-70 family)